MPVKLQFAALIAVAVLTTSDRSALAQQTAINPPQTDCDLDAADPLDPGRVAPGVEFTGTYGTDYKYDEQVNTAKQACEAAIAKYPNSPRIRYELGRAWEAYGWHGTDVNSGLSDIGAYYAAASAGWVAAQLRLALLFAYGTPQVQPDSAQAMTWFQKALSNPQQLTAGERASAVATIQQAQAKQAGAAQVQSQQAQAQLATLIADAKQKGPDYAVTSGTSWKEQTHKNELTDETEVTAISDQTNGTGARARITASCATISSSDDATRSSLGAYAEPSQQGYHEIRFDALITDTSGQPTVHFPKLTLKGTQGYIGQSYASAMARINDDMPQSIFIYTKDYTNQFSILDLDVKKSSILWRYLIQIDTTAGSFLLKIPTFDPAIQAAIAACG